jgi:hypothetical protein
MRKKFHPEILTELHVLKHLKSGRVVSGMPSACTRVYERALLEPERLERCSMCGSLSMTSWCPVFINILIPKIVAFQEPLQKKTYN